MRWKLHTFRGGHVESFDRMMREIGEEHAAEAEGGGKWQLGVALGAACHAAGQSYNGQKMWDKGKAAYERALRLRLDALGEQHPATAGTLQSLGATYGYMGDQGSAIMLCERALRIYKDTLGPHPDTAGTMSNMGAAYDRKGQSKEAIELYQQALRIYESTVGRMHRHAAEAIHWMSTAYYKLGDFARAEELGLEAEKIYEETLGKDHKETKEARDNLAAIRQKAKSLGRGRGK
jgi:tetratricopeptide (TPR) repeat protein